MGEEEEERSSSTNYNHVWFYRTNKNPNNNKDKMRDIVCSLCFIELPNIESSLEPLSELTDNSIMKNPQVIRDENFVGQRETIKQT